MLASCKQTERGCLEWQGIIDHSGYGRVAHGSAYWTTHRLMWRLTHGYPKLFVLHKCDNRKCINPEHLFEGTAKDNARDASAKGRSKEMQKTHCRNGHEYTPENTILKKQVNHRGSNGRRCCRICNNESSRKSMKRRFDKARAALESEK